MSIKGLSFKDLVGHSNADLMASASTWTAPEGIDIPNIAPKVDASSLPQFGFGVGIRPYLRGPYASMFTIRPWTIRQYAGFSTAEA